MASFPPETREELAAKADFKTNIWNVFQELYGDRWDKARWDAAAARFLAQHDPTVVQRFWARARLPPWDRLEANMRSGPPPFLRPGWKSPLQGTHADLRWLTEDAFECVKGSLDGWRDKKVLLIEFWASWCRPCLTAFRDLSNISATRPDIKIITFNVEGIFTKAPIDVATVRAFVRGRQDMEYPVYIDVNRVAVQAIFEPGQTLSIPLVFIITPKDGLIHWVGNPEEMAAPLAQALASA